MVAKDIPWRLCVSVWVMSWLEQRIRRRRRCTTFEIVCAVEAKLGAAMLARPLPTIQLLELPMRLLFAPLLEHHSTTSTRHNSTFETSVFLLGCSRLSTILLLYVSQLGKRKTRIGFIAHQLFLPGLGTSYNLCAGSEHIVKQIGDTYRSFYCPQRPSDLRNSYEFRDRQDGVSGEEQAREDGQSD